MCTYIRTICIIQRYNAIYYKSYYTEYVIVIYFIQMKFIFPKALKINLFLELIIYS